MKDPNLNEQEHLINQLKNPTLDEQLKNYSKALQEADKINNESESMAEAVADLIELYENHIEKLDEDRDRIIRKANIDVSRSAYEIYWKERGTATGNPIYPNVKSSTPPTLDKIYESKKSMESTLLNKLVGAGEEYTKNKNKFEKIIYDEKEKLGLNLTAGSLRRLLKTRRKKLEEE
tara:strand:- start:984 stop:1514 length:531 start_codon:yes stop_codon:yes gene_type:complete